MPEGGSGCARRVQRVSGGAGSSYPTCRDVLGYARAHLRGDSWRARRLPTFDEEVERLHEILDDLSAQLATADLADGLPDRLLQGPLSDAMSHAGQLAMLRRLAGSPVPPENFIVARIDANNVGPHQPEPESEDKEWFDAENEPY